MRIKSGFVLEEIAGSYIAVAVGKRAEEFHVLIRLNSTGAFLWRALEEADLSQEELVLRMTEEYSVDESIAKRDVSAFIGKITEAGLLDE